MKKSEDSKNNKTTSSDNKEESSDASFDWLDKLVMVILGVFFLTAIFNPSLVASLDMDTDSTWIPAENPASPEPELTSVYLTQDSETTLHVHSGPKYEYIIVDIDGLKQKITDKSKITIKDESNPVKITATGVDINGSISGVQETKDVLYEDTVRFG